MTAAVTSVPNGPGLVIVKVPPVIWSMPSRSDRARAARSEISRAIPTRRLLSASWITGTISPSNDRSTAMPRWMS